MADVALREILEAAQADLEGGKHQATIAACRHVLRHYPDAITALRLLGEANLEDGRVDEARRCFERVLDLEPCNVLARIGLAVIAEDRGEEDRAIAQFRLAWEVEPFLPQLRGELVRLYRKRYGAGGRLRMTRVALANLHARNEDLLRAIRQFRLLRVEQPDRPDLPIGLAQALWRHDEPAEAAAICREALAARPHTARAALLLAAIAGDQRIAGSSLGDSDEAERQLATARAYDPDAVLARDLVALHPSDTLTAFINEPVLIPAYDPSAPVPETEDQLLAQGFAAGGAAAPAVEEAPTRWEDIASGWTTEAPLDRDQPGAPVLEGALPPATDDLGQFAALDSELGESVAPFALPAVDEPADVPAWLRESELPSTPGGDPAAPEVASAPDEQPAVDMMAPQPGELSAVERLTANWDNIDDELAAARPSDDLPGMTGMLSALEDETGVAPFDIESAADANAPDAITFDPSKFSLPPLEGEDEDEDDLAAIPAGVEADVAPFSFDERGAAGRGFTDMIDQRAGDDAAPTATSVEPHVPETSLPEYTSIFATHDLGAMDEEPLAATSRASAEPAEQYATSAPDAPEAAADLPAPEAPAPSEAWLTAEAPPAAPAPEAQAAGDAETGEGMDKFFSRLRRRKQEQIQTGELTINRPVAPRTVLPSTPAATAQAEPQVASAAAPFETRELSSWAAGEIAASAEPTVEPAARPEAPEPAHGDAEQVTTAAAPPAPEPAAGETAELAASPEAVAEPAGEPEEPVTAASTIDDWFTSSVPPVADEAPPAETPSAPTELAAEPAAPPASGEVLPPPADQDLVAAVADVWEPVPGGPLDAPTPPVESSADQLSALEAMVEADPQNAFARLTLAVAYSATRPEQALTEYRRLVKESDELVPEVVERLREMIADGEGGPRAHRVLGDAYMKLGQYDLAMAEFQRALAGRAKK